MSRRPIAKTVFLTTVMAAALLLAEGQFCNGGHHHWHRYGNYGYPYPGVYYYPNTPTPNWSNQYGPNSNYQGQHGQYLQPIVPNDWGEGPYGPRHNLSSSQHNPSGYIIRSY